MGVPVVAFTPGGGIVQLEESVAEIRVEGIVLLEPGVLAGIAPEFRDGKRPRVELCHTVSSQFFVSALFSTPAVSSFSARPARRGCVSGVGIGVPILPFRKR